MRRLGPARRGALSTRKRKRHVVTSASALPPNGGAGGVLAPNAKRARGKRRVGPVSAEGPERPGRHGGGTAEQPAGAAAAALGPRRPQQSAACAQPARVSTAGTGAGAQPAEPRRADARLRLLQGLHLPQDAQPGRRACGAARQGREHLAAPRGRRQAQGSPCGAARCPPGAAGTRGELRARPRGPVRLPVRVLVLVGPRCLHGR